jgi:molybdopterin/thiamine biosynthesis adenylyltransferase
MNIRYKRQSFLGPRSEGILNSCKIAAVGLGGGGSHIVQQLAHIGIGSFLLVDGDVVEEHNLNRLVGATADDAVRQTPKVEVSKRLMAAVNPEARVNVFGDRWQLAPELLRDCDCIFGCLDSYSDRSELERTARRFLIPYLDIGMDVFPRGSGFLISGQIALSLPDEPCLWCMGLINEDLLTKEAQEYGAAGGRPQVVWPNAILASNAVGLFMQLVTPWNSRERLPMLLEYDGNEQTVMPSNKLPILNKKVSCPHHPPQEVGDPFYCPTTGDSLHPDSHHRNETISTGKEGI